LKYFANCGISHDQETNKPVGNLARSAASLGTAVINSLCVVDTSQTESATDMLYNNKGHL